MGLPIYSNGVAAPGTKKADDVIPKKVQNPTNQVSPVIALGSMPLS